MTHYVKVVLAENEAELKALHFAEFSNHTTWKQMEPFVKKGNAFTDGVVVQLPELTKVTEAMVYAYDNEEQDWFIAKCFVYTDVKEHYITSRDLFLI